MKKIFSFLAVCFAAVVLLASCTKKYTVDFDSSGRHYKPPYHGASRNSFEPHHFNPIRVFTWNMGLLSKCILKQETITNM